MSGMVKGSGLPPGCQSKGLWREFTKLQHIDTMIMRQLQCIGTFLIHIITQKQEMESFVFLSDISLSWNFLAFCYLSNFCCLFIFGTFSIRDIGDHVNVSNPEPSSFLYNESTQPRQLSNGKSDGFETKNHTYEKFYIINKTRQEVM
jgi:hypothetical protein